MKAKIKVLSRHLKGSGNKIIGHGTITDEELNYYGWGDRKKELKFIVVKGFIDDWAIYLEKMDSEQTLNEVKELGNKIHRVERIKHLVDCSEAILKRYRQ